MVTFRLMARRPELPKREEILSREQLNELRQSLARLSPAHVEDFYRGALDRCRLIGNALPAARTIQELVQAWKLLRKWRK